MGNRYRTTRDRFAAIQGCLADLKTSLTESDPDRSAAVGALQQQLSKRRFRVAVIATTSTGKSTLVNALLGYELMPMADEAKTAVPVSILPSQPGATAQIRVEFLDGSEVQEFPIDLGDATPAREFLDGLMAPENSGRLAGIEVVTPIAAFAEFTADLPEVQLIDTPGPSTGGRADHREHALRALAGAHAAIYLFDFKRPLQDSDEDLLSRIRDGWQKQGLQRVAGKLFFAVNRADDRGKDSKQSPSERAAADTARAAEVLGVGDLRPALPISARAALYARLAIRGEPFSEDADFEYMQTVARLRHYAKKEGNAELLAVGDNEEFALRASGLAELERLIYEFLVGSALDELARDALDRALEIAEAARRDIHRKVALWEDEGQEIEARLSRTKEALDSFRQEFLDAHEAWSRSADDACSALTHRAVGDFMKEVATSIHTAREEEARVGGVFQAMTKDVRDLWKRVNLDKVEEFRTKGAARERQAELAGLVTAALGPHQAQLVVGLNDGLGRQSRSQVQDYRQRMGAITRRVEAAIQRELGPAAAFPDAEPALPAPPGLDDMALKIVDVGAKKVTRTKKKTVKKRPWYFLWLFKVERKVDVSTKEQVFTISLKNVMERIEATYRQELEEWRDEVVTHYREHFIEPAEHHYRSAATHYLDAIDQLLDEHLQARKEHVDQEAVIADLKVRRERVARELGRGRKLRTHFDGT